MPYGAYNGPDKPNKGHKGGACNRQRCQDEPANWYNRGSLSWYCTGCARTLNEDTFNKREAQQLYGGPLCIRASDLTGPDTTPTVQGVTEGARAAARTWLHAYGILTDRYTAAGGDHPAMDTLPAAFEAYAAAQVRAGRATQAEETVERMRQGKDRFAAGVRAAITWLHTRAWKMNDPQANAILNSAATNLGWDLAAGRVPSGAAALADPATDAAGAGAPCALASGREG